jgi:molybdopterin synthase catalytic subunit
MVERFERDGFCPFGAQGMHMGFVRSVDRNDGGFMITVEVTEPELEERFKQMKGQ